jgi:prevent-host-death family protein
MAKWQVQDAKARLSELIEKARTEGPQTITRHGNDAAVVISMEEYRRLGGESAGREKKTLVEFLLTEGPVLPDDFNIDRNPDTGRDFKSDE